MSMSESFGRTSFARAVNSLAGRLVRIIVGLGLIGAGYLLREGIAGPALAVLGLIPLAAGLFNWCLISALLGGPLDGDKVGSPKA